MLTRVGIPAGSTAEPMAPDPKRPTLICFSHLRWNFVFQRPQHLMSRFARDMVVIYWEEPVDIAHGETPFLQVREAEGYDRVKVVVPHLPEGISAEDRDLTLARLLEAHTAAVRGPLVAWYYTPMMLSFSRDVPADAVVYDCMDELSKFRFAPETLLSLEQELIDKANLVFTGGSSLYEAKKNRHDSVHCFPSSVDRTHFAKARAAQFDPGDQEDLPRPRLGFYGVIDERVDIDLLGQIATLRPDWSFVIIGPVVKIAQDELPHSRNIHYLGGKSYEELPAYLSGWDVALMPFAMNDSTEFISPTKTPEYLAGGKPVVSTPVKDVVRHYGHLQGVQIADGAEAFVAGCDKALELARNPGGGWLSEADLLLSSSSWDTTQARMAGLIRDALGQSASAAKPAMLVAAE